MQAFRLKKLSVSSTRKDLLITLFGSGLAALLGSAFFVIVSRLLGPTNFGIFSALVMLIVLISDIADLGVSAGLPNFVSRAEKLGDLQSAGRFLNLSLVLKILVATSVVALGFIFSHWLSATLFKRDIEPGLLPWALTGGILMAVYSFSLSALQARRKFATAAFLNVSGNSARLLFLLLIGLGFSLSISSGIAFYLAGLAVTAIGGLVLLPVGLLRNLPTKTDLHSFFSFNKWLALGVLLYAIFTRLDSILLVSLKNPYEAGVYAAASRVTFVFPFIISGLAAVWSSRFSAFSRDEEALLYFKKSFVTSGFISLVSLLAIPLAPFIVRLVFGTDYLGSITPLIILVLGWVAFLLAVPAVQFITYYLSRPDLYAFSTLTQFIAIVSLDFSLIPQLGAVGAAVAFLVGNVLNLVFCVFVLLGKGNIQIMDKAVHRRIRYEKPGNS